MDKKGYFALSMLCIVCVACVTAQGNDKTEITTRYFCIKSIVPKDSIFIIYAERNDSLFKILSKKEITNDTGYCKIRKGGCYSFDLISLFPKFILGYRMMPPGGGGATAIYYYGTGVSIEPDKGIWDLFEAINLKGLYCTDGSK